MSMTSMETQTQPVFKARRALADFTHFSADNASKCDECELEKASVFCKNCEQHLCNTCTSKIHNKGKRAQHVIQQVKTIDYERPSQVLFLSFDSFKNTAQCQPNDQDLGAKLLQFIKSILELNKINSDEIAIYIYYNSDDELSQELVSDLCESLASLKYCFFINADKLQAAREIQEVHLNTDEMLKASTEKENQLAKCLNALAREYQNVYIYDDANSIQLGFSIFSSESSDITESQKVFIAEGTENADENHIMKMVELTPKKSMKFMNKSKQTEKRKNSYQHHTQDHGDSKKMALSTTHGDVSSEFFENSKYIENFSSSDESRENQQNTLKKSSKDDLTLSQSTSKTMTQVGRATAHGSSLNQSTEHKAYSQSHGSNANQSFEEREILSSKPYFEAVNSTLEYKTPTSVGIKPQKTGHGAKHHHHHHGGAHGLIRQPLKDYEVDGSLKLSHYLQGELNKLALQGELMIPKDQFGQMIDETVRNKFHKKTEDVLEKAQDAEIIHITTRKFADEQTFTYVGLKLDTITIESLGWVCRSIKRDAMAPTEKLILSRIKECFAFKLDSKLWKALVNLLLNYQNNNKKFPAGDTTILPLTISTTIDASTGAETYVVYIKGEEWESEDTGTIDENSPGWKAFTAFLDEFFKEDEEGQSKKESSQLDSKESSKQVGYQKYDKYAAGSVEGKAIPGGRYGCAQFIKICGPEELRKESLGKLNLYVQEAINKGILRYQRTLLVKNTQAGIFEGKYIDQLEAKNDPAHEKRVHQLKKIKEALIEILAENPNGLSLAQIPQYLRRKITFSFNLQEMGFPKLKNLLATMTDDIKIELSGTNHSYASLKNPEKYSHLSRRNKGHHDYFGADDSQNLFGYTVDTTKSPYLSSPDYADNQDYSADFPQEKQYAKRFNTLTPDTQSLKSSRFGYRKKYNSSFEGYLQKIKLLIEEIVTQSIYGLGIDHLYNQLSVKLGTNFDYSIFDCRTFYEFLINHAEDLIDIQVKKLHGMPTTSYLIFPKNFRFRPGFGAKEPTKTEQTPMKISKPPLHSGPTSWAAGGFPSTFGSQSKPLSTVQTIPQINTSKQAEQHKEKFYLSPIVFYGSQEENAAQEEESPAHHRHESYLNFNFGAPESNFSGISGIQNLQYSQFDSKGSRIHEESYMETNENIRFIENLLSDNDGNMNSGISFHEPKEEAISFLSSTAGYSDKNNHVKTLSGDFNTYERTSRHPPGLAVHGRGNSAFANVESYKLFGSPKDV